jgi:hypothetical protein
MQIHYHDNTKQYVKMLQKKHGDLAIAGSQTVNEAAEEIKKAYDKELKNNFTLRNKFTQGAVKLQKSNPQHKSGEFRKLTGINAKVGVLKMKGGKEHYLKLQEEGGTKTGHEQTQGKVPIPVDKTTRIAGAHAGVIKGALQLQRAGAIQTLVIGGRKIGFEDDSFGARNGSQRWAILYKYTGLSGKGAAGKGKYIGKYGWNLNKQFYFTGKKRGFGIFKFQGKGRIHLIRTLEKRSVRIKATHGFQKSVKTIGRADMDRMFVRNARRILGY